MTNIRARQPYARRPAPQNDLKPFLDTEFANIQRGIPVPVVRAVFADDTVQASDDTIEVDATAGAVTITLPPPDRFQFLRVTVIRVDAGTHEVLVSGTMNGTSSLALESVGDFLTVQSDGSAWLVLSTPPDFFNVTRFGAVGDGVHDDTTAIQAAIDACPAGAIVLVRGGRFACTAGLTITKPITLAGGDNRNANLPDADSFSAIVFTTDVAVGIDATANFCIKSLIVSGVGLGVSTGIGVRATDFSLVTEDVVIQAFNTGLHVTEGFYNRFTRTRVEFCKIAGILDSCYNSTASQSSFNGRQESGATGIELLNGSSLTLIGCSIESFRTAGLYLFDGSSVSLFGCYFEGEPQLADSGRAVILTDGCSVVAIGTQVFLTVNNKQFIGVEGSGTVGVRVFSRNNRLIYPTDTSSVQVYSPAVDSTASWDVAGDNWQSDAGVNAQYVNSTFANAVPAIGSGRFSFLYPVDYTDSVSDISTLPPPKATTIPSVASAATIALPRGWEMVTITGTTTITSITATNQGNRRVTLVFAGILTLTDGSNLKLNGNFVTTADDTITLVCDGTSWFEVSRSAN